MKGSNVMKHIYKLTSLAIAAALVLSGCVETKTPADSEKTTETTASVTTTGTEETTTTTTSEAETTKAVTAETAVNEDIVTETTAPCGSAQGIILDYDPDWIGVDFNRREFYLGDIKPERLYSLLEQLEPIESDHITLALGVDSSGFAYWDSINFNGDKKVSFMRLLSNEGWIITGFGSQLYRESSELTELFAEMMRNGDYNNVFYTEKDREKREPALVTDDIYRGQMYGSYRLYGSKMNEKDAYEAYVTGNGQTYPLYVLKGLTDETDVYIGDYFFPDMPDEPGEYVLHAGGLESTFNIRDFSEFPEIINVNVERTENGAQINIVPNMSGRIGQISFYSDNTLMTLMHDDTDTDSTVRAGESLTEVVRGYTDNELADAFEQVKNAIETEDGTAMYILDFYGIGCSSTDSEIKEIIGHVCSIEPEREYAVVLLFETDDGNEYFHYIKF